MGAALLGKQEAGAGDGGARPGLERPLDVGPLRDPAGEKQRVAAGQRLAHLGEQLECGDSTPHMAAGLDALDDEGIGGGGMRRACLADRAALVDPYPCGPPSRPAPEGDDGVGACRRLEPAAPGEGQQQVDRERPVGQLAGGAQLPFDRTGAVDGDRAEAAGLGNGRRQLVAAETAAHAGLDYRGSKAKPLENTHAHDRRGHVCAKMLP